MGELTVVANLYKNDAQTYDIRVRWVLGENGPGGAPSDSKLPLKGDEFLTTIRKRDGAYLQGDLTWGPKPESGKDYSHQFHVKPMLDVMLDPPREPKEVQGQDGRFFRRVAGKPTEKVADGDLFVDVNLGEDQGIAKRLKPGKGLGVRHLLDGADKAKNLIDTRNLIETGLISAERAMRAQRGGDKLQFTTETAGWAAEGLAKLLVNSGARPQEFTQEFARLHRTLVAHAADRAAFDRSTRDFLDGIGREAALMPFLGLRKAHSKAEVFSAVALAMTVFSDEAFLKSVERTSFEPEQVRRQLKLKALQGGTLIDFWAQTGDPKKDDSLRGEIYPAFQTLGLGINLTQVPAGTIDALTSGPDHAFIEIKTRAASGSYGTGTTLLLPGDITRARNEGMAFRPTPPRDAKINFDLTRNDPPSTTHANGKERRIDADEPGFKTGNGAIEFHITPAFPRYQERDDAGQIVPNGAKVATETAFNVYCVWEGAGGMDAYFSDTSQVPSLAELRPYLVTRRYSYQRDLHGAFPNINGATHPKLGAMLAAPPWEAVLRRAEKVKDFNNYQASAATRPGEDDAPTVPDEFYGGADGPTIFSFDLRRGLSATAVPPAGLFAGWDPRAETDELWSPIKYRGQADNLDRPQALRLFVTSVDSFDDESTPVAVRARDADAGDTEDSYLFRPTYRTQILSAEEVSLATDGSKLSMSWTMPVQPAEYGLLSTLEAFEQAGHHLRGEIRVYRRRVVPTVNEDEIRAVPVPQAANDVHWRGVEDDFLRRGWQRVPTLDQRVDIAASGGQGTLDIPLAYNDRGYEYAAGLSVTVPDKASVFWSAPAETRRMYYLKRSEATSGEYSVEEGTIIDAPSSSTVGVSDPVAVPNVDLPRAPEALDQIDTMAFADPVIPIPGVQRDPILARIATQPNNSEELPPDAGSRSVRRRTKFVAADTWQDTPFVLNKGQAASAEGALRRTLPRLRTILGPPDIDVDAPELAIPRHLLAQSFLRFAEATQTPGLDVKLKPEIGLHPSIGFRGILQLKWKYVPHIRRAPTADDAETTAFDIFQAIIPNGEDRARAQARSVLPTGMAPAGSARRTTDGYAVTLVLEPGEDTEQARLLERLQSGRQPICGLYQKNDEDRMYPFHVASAALSGNVLSLHARQVQNALGDGYGTVFLFFPTVVTQAPTVGLDQPGRPGTGIAQSVLLPVPGGESEFGFWYIVPRSGANRRGSSDRSLLVFRELSDTIEPTAPAQVDLAPPFDRSTIALDPRNPSHEPFLPDAITDAEDGRSNPRLLLTWAPANDDSLLVVIYRQEERLDKDPKSFRTELDERYQQWRDIDTIRNLPEGAILAPELLERLSNPNNGWLSGGIVETEPGAITPKTPFIGPEAGLSAQAGLDILPDTGSYIDYRQTVENNNAADAMDANLRYRYQLQFARKLPTLTRSGTLESAPVYLMSPLSTWTSWMVPETPPIEAKLRGTETDTIPDAFNPHVAFSFKISDASWAGARALRRKSAFVEELDWEYRIVIRRKLHVLSPSESGSELVENHKEVGLALTINPKNSEDEFIVSDTRIERNYAEEDLLLDYDVYIQQFAIRGTPGNFVEQPVRSHEEIPTLAIRGLELPAPNSPSQSVMEIRRTVKVEIR